ncbi:MAG: FtsH protease activity modulator HflK [Polynucleobacter sp.]|jgi:membrane protease subunit HflK|nr:FtsH protease activity modulator HflK [Polynucleobacter sp.]
MRKLLNGLAGIFSINDPGWGNNPQSGSKPDPKAEPKEGEAGDGGQSSPPEPRPNPNPRPGQNAGPPDLDELWRDFNNRLGGLFGGGKKDGNPSAKKPAGGGNSGGGGRGGRTPPSFNLEAFNPKLGAMIAAAILFVVWIFSGFFIVQEGQAGVILTFGKYDYSTGPGINWRMPWPIQNQQIVNLSGVRSVEVGRPVVIKGTNQKDSSMLTEDENIIDVRFAVQYRLKDPADYLFNNRDPDMAVIQAAETAVREIVGRSKMDTVLYEGREKIAVDLSIAIQKILDLYKSGIFITSVTVQNVQPPEQVQAAFDDAVKAGQDQERLKSEGEAYANDILPRAKGTAARLIQEAEGYKARVVATAEGDAIRFKQIQTEYAKAPQVTRDRMYIDAMKEIYTNVSKVMVDTTKSNPLLFLPLDKIISQVSSESQQAAQTGSSAGLNPNESVVNPSKSSSANSSLPIPSASAGSSSDRNLDRRDRETGLRSRDRIER